MKLFWRYQIAGTGLAYGYSKSARAIKEALVRRGVELCDDAEVALSYVAADVFNRCEERPVTDPAGSKGFAVSNTWGEYILMREDSGRAHLSACTAQAEGPAPTDVGAGSRSIRYAQDKGCPDRKREFLFTMFEADQVPPNFAEGLRRPDEIIATCRHNLRVFRRYCGGRPVHVCRLGVDPEVYRYRDRYYPSPSPSPNGRGNRGEGGGGTGIPACVHGQDAHATNNKFRFLWLGSISRRKGWDLAVRAFQATFRPGDPVEIYFKTTGPGRGVVELHDNVIYDDRNYSEAALRDLYYSAHALIFPSRGDAFGLPAAEAMATGCLVIAPRAQGLTEFISERTAVVVKHGWIRAEFGIELQVPNCDLTDLALKMRHIVKNYDALKGRARAGAEFVRANLTWDHTAKRLIEIIWGQGNPAPIRVGHPACAGRDAP